MDQPVVPAGENEQAQLEQYLKRAVEGHGRVAFSITDTGPEKAAFASNFTQKMRDSYHELVIANGNCNANPAFSGPYLPFREILGRFCGIAESRWESRSITWERAKRLWQCLPMTVQAIVQSGGALVDTFVSSDILIRRVSAYPEWAERAQWASKLENLVKSRGSKPELTSVPQSTLFEEYLAVLQAVAREKSLLLVIEDLQWADIGSINLLAYIGKRIEKNSILILGTYRAKDLKSARDGETHLLLPVLEELKQQFGDR